MTTFDKVWGLWPSITEMGSALGEGVWGLYKRRKRSLLPDSRHDVTLVRRASEAGVELTFEDLANWRAVEEDAA